jgi:hypothetical protein
LIETVVIAVAVLLVVSFLLSNVLPNFFQLKRRSERVKSFRTKYAAWATGQEDNRSWLLARKAEMQRDAESVDLGVQPSRRHRPSEVAISVIKCSWTC